MHMLPLSLSSYLDTVLKPIVAEGFVGRDGDLIAWLTRQIDEWELEAERPDGIPFAAGAIEALELILDRMRERLALEIAAA